MLSQWVRIAVCVQFTFVWHTQLHKPRKYLLHTHTLPSSWIIVPRYCLYRMYVQQLAKVQGNLRQLLAQFSISIFNVNIELWGEMLTLNCEKNRRFLGNIYRARR
jgi:hypothetical protein